MTQTNFDHLGGVGINASWSVMRDGKRVGMIERNGNTGFIVRSHYRRIIDYARNSAGAKEKCLHRERFPSEREIYDLICAEVEVRRRVQLENKMRAEMFALARDLVVGSNSARDAIAEILADIETLAKDRWQTTRPPKRPFPSDDRYDEKLVSAWRDDQQERFRGKPMYWQGDSTYPKPPGQ